MPSRTYILSSNESDFTTFYSPAFKLDDDKRYEAALISIDIYNSSANIVVGKNDLFIYSSDNGDNWKTISLGTGSYRD